MENEEFIEIGWKYNLRDSDSSSFIVEASSFTNVQQQQDFEQNSTKIPADKEWRVYYKGPNLTTTIHDPLLCLFRVQILNIRRHINVHS